MPDTVLGALHYILFLTLTQSMRIYFPLIFKVSRKEGGGEEEREKERGKKEREREATLIGCLLHTP